MRKPVLIGSVIVGLVVSLASWAPPTSAAAVMLSHPNTIGVTPYPVPAEVVPGRQLETAQARSHRWDEFPYQRFEVNGVSAGMSISWSGTTVNRNELQLLAWDHVAGQWSDPIASAAPETPNGTVALQGNLDASHVDGGAAVLLVIDGPRTSTDFIDANATPDGRFADPDTYDFSLLHMTDTQFLAEEFNDEFNAMTRWTAENADHFNIGFVAHTGDLIENWIFPTDDKAVARREFQVAQDAMSRLDDVVPYGVLPGNHDNLWNIGSQINPEAHRANSALYNEYFGPQHFRDRPYWGGSVTDNDNSANFQLAEIAGAKFLFLNIGYNPTETLLRWAERVLAEHPEYNVVLGTHYYLDASGSRAIRTPIDLLAGSGEEMFRRLVTPFENVFLVLSGHIHAQATTVDRNVGSTDRTVVQMLADYQNFEVQGQRRTAFQRLLQIDIGGQMMAVTTHSPALNTTAVQNYDPENRYRPEDGEFVQPITLRADVPRAVI